MIKYKNKYVLAGIMAMIILSGCGAAAKSTQATAEKDASAAAAQERWQ